MRVAFSATVDSQSGDRLHGNWSRRCGELDRPGRVPGRSLGRLADEELSDASGLEPWWVCKDGGISRFVFDVPMSEQQHWLQWVQKQRWLYRLVLGQPNQEDLLERLAANDGLTDAAVRAAAINLSPWFSKKQAK